MALDEAADRRLLVGRVDVLWAGSLPLTSLAVPFQPLTSALREWAGRGMPAPVLVSTVIHSPWLASSGATSKGRATDAPPGAASRPGRRRRGRLDDGQAPAAGDLNCQQHRARPHHQQSRLDEPTRAPRSRRRPATPHKPQNPTNEQVAKLRCSRRARRRPGPPACHTTSPDHDRLRRSGLVSPVSSVPSPRLCSVA
jgi:hypothetical protein